MKTDKQGCSTTAAGREQYETFARKGGTFVQYDYRTADGELFSCIRSTLEECRAKRDEWLKSR